MSVFSCVHSYRCQLLIQLSRLRRRRRGWQKTETIVLHLYLILYCIVLRWLTNVVVNQSIWSRTCDVLIVCISYACTGLSTTTQTLWYFVCYNILKKIPFCFLIYRAVNESAELNLLSCCAHGKTGSSQEQVPAFKSLKV